MTSRFIVSLTLLALACSPYAVADEATREVKLEDLTLHVPGDWKQQRPSNNLRLGQFEIPAAEGDPEPAELTVFNFGAGGGVKANVDRWIEQFQADGRQAKATQGKGAAGEYVFVNISGTYKKPIGPPILNKTEPKADYRMLGVILSLEKKGLYFLKLTGPDKTVAKAAAALRTSIGGKEQDEKAYEAK